jgi:hypothetical protein
MIKPLGNCTFTFSKSEWIFDNILSTIAFVGVTTNTGEYSFNKSKQHLEITVDFPVPGGPVIGMVLSPFILFLAEYCSWFSGMMLKVSELIVSKFADNYTIIAWNEEKKKKY